MTAVPDHARRDVGRRVISHVVRNRSAPSLRDVEGNLVGQACLEERELDEDWRETRRQPDENARRRYLLL